MPLTLLAPIFLLAQVAPVFPGFSTGLTGWAVHPRDTVAKAIVFEGTPVFRLTVPAEQPVDFRQASWSCGALPGNRWEARVEAREETPFRDGVGAMLVMAFLDEGQQRIGACEARLCPGLDGWNPLIVRGAAPEKTEKIQISLLLHGHGSVLFRNPSVEGQPAPTAPAPGAPIVLEATSEVTCPALVGFGAEDDGWYFNSENAAKGANEETYAACRKRIEFLRPQYIRMFFWYRDFNPSMDGETFTWDSDNMRSHYRTLDQYQALGTRVNACGVEWGVEKAFEQPEKLAKIAGELVQHLIKEKGYTCVQDWTLTNEPNLSFAYSPGSSFEVYTRLHELAADEFKKRGLTVNLVGSDDGDGFSWFAGCVRDDRFFKAVSLFASHYYVPEIAAPFLSETLGDRTRVLAERKPRKPFIVAEFGLQDHRFKPPATNPFMREYPYALRCFASFIDGLDAGAAGFSMWCLQEMYYPGGETPMQFGLWDFATGGKTVRPIYHAVAAFTRNTKPGDPVYRWQSSRPEAVKAVKVGDTLFWANLLDVPVRVEARGFGAGEAQAYTEQNLPKDWECFDRIALDADGVFAAPARSFGICKRK